jgi:hypothetical protein
MPANAVPALSYTTPRGTIQTRASTAFSSAFSITGSTAI